MTTTPEVDDQIRRVDEAQKFVKLRMLGAYDRAMEQAEKERPIRDNEKDVVEIVWFSDDIQLVEKRHRHRRDGDPETWWMPYIGGSSSGKLFATKEQAILGALADKYDGANSQFAEFAWRMLGNK